ncbi:head-tail connector protein [Roseisalinus antarcticus]|uniref:Phage gp6-like head-tail connector protein n=1 Tax=Roseisalinus antarcticus TaxID=254357 RepID=A0A1Y5T2K5_9RHOB|nr:head-tail connector protein [Roseisalinus antarcticus]SLN54492.1 Phage gp6-like head-tail connector protein [Roseisalinus antarcticus]
MMLIEETTVPQSALPVAEFKDHLRLGTGFGEDDLQDAVLESYLRAAMAAIEARTGKILIERSFSWSVTFWRDQTAQTLPVAPVSAMEDFAIVDRGGQETGADLADIQLAPDMQRPRIRATHGCLPSIPAGGFVQMRFIAGFGPEWSDLPADLAQAVMMLAAHYYDYRHEAGLSGGALPYSVNALIERYRTVRLFGGGR